MSEQAANMLSRLTRIEELKLKNCLSSREFSTIRRGGFTILTYTLSLNRCFSLKSLKFSKKSKTDSQTLNVYI